MNKKNKKLKLTRLTVANLDRVKGGKYECGCQYTTGDAAYNYYGTQTLAKSVCPCG